MAAKQKKSRGYTIFMAVMIVLLILAIALFVYGSMHNGIIQPRLPGKGFFAWGATLLHG